MFSYLNLIYERTAYHDPVTFHCIILMGLDESSRWHAVATDSQQESYRKGGGVGGWTGQQNIQL